MEDEEEGAEKGGDGGRAPEALQSGWRSFRVNEALPTFPRSKRGALLLQWCVNKAALPLQHELLVHTDLINTRQWHTVDIAVTSDLAML